MASSFLFCFPLKTSYNVAGIFYSMAAIYSFAYMCATAISPFFVGNLIVFGLPATFWAIDQISPQKKYKQRFRCLYLWLTLVWAFLLSAFIGLILLALSSWGSSLGNDGLRIILICLFLFLVVALPTIYIARCINAYINLQKVPTPLPDSDNMVIILLASQN